MASIIIHHPNTGHRRSDGGKNVEAAGQRTVRPQRGEERVK